MFLLIPATILAQGGESAFNFLRLPYSSRAAALGGSNISVIEDDLSMAMHNPALLINVSDKTIDLSFMTYMSSSKVAGAAFNKTFGERSSGAVAARYIDYGTFDGYTQDNIFTGTFRAMDIELSFMYCYLLSEHWSGGVSGKFIYSQYESLNSLALGVDLGLNYYNPDIDFSASLTFKNLGGQVMTFEEKHEIMPIDIQLGLTKRLSYAPILLSVTFVDLHRWRSTDFYNADGSKDNFGELLLKHIVLGADVLIGNNFYASIGYNYRISRELSTGKGLTGFSLGAGLHINKVKFGASFSQLHTSSSSLLFNIAYSI
ncbi:MAG: type IX secretion system protein PorQ [Bacteroidaceae bacterium]|nr:type IX secretion system protein PorQ [Bacteroidaceae bacterium]